MRTSEWFIFCCFLSAVILSSRVSGQVSQWKTFTNGNNITDIEADADTVWVGTEGGLVKIVKPTGETTFYNKLNSGLSDNYILRVKVAPDGKKWIGTAAGGLSIWDGITWKVFDTANSVLESNQIWDIDFDSTGTAWIAGYSGLLKSNYDSLWQFSTVTSYCIKIDSLQKVWIGSGTTLKCYDGSDWHSYDLTMWDFINSIDISDEGLVWLATSGGLFKFNGDTFTKIYQALLATSRSVSIAADGNIWVGSNYGIGKLSGNDFEFFYPVDNGMTDNEVFEIETDQSNNVWIGTRNGLAIFSSPPWTIYNTSTSSIPENYIKSIAIDRYGNKWMGSWFNAGLIYFDDTEWSVFQPDEGTTSIDHVIIDTNNVKWISDMLHGIQSFNDTSWTYYNTANSGLPGNYVRSIFADKDNNIWVGTDYNGAARFDHSDWTYYDTTNTCMEQNSVQDIYIEDNGNKWFANDWFVNRISNSGCEVFNSSNSGLANDFIKRIIADHQGKVWFGLQQGGISGFDGINWNTYILGNNGYYTVNDMVVDEANNLWVGTNGAGLYKFDGTGMINYTVTNSGLCCNEILSLAIDSLGTKWIGTSAGLSLFNEDGFVPNHYIASTHPSLKVYPNPSGESLTISLANRLKATQIQILNINGILISNIASLAQETTINVSHFKPGLYLVRIQANDGVHIGKFVKL